jgi:hypothetical protein
MTVSAAWLETEMPSEGRVPMSVGRIDRMEEGRVASSTCVAV